MTPVVEEDDPTVPQRVHFPFPSSQEPLGPAWPGLKQCLAVAQAHALAQGLVGSGNPECPFHTSDSGTQFTTNVTVELMVIRWQSWQRCCLAIGYRNVKPGCVSHFH